MKTVSLLRKLFPCILGLGLVATARADRIELADGSVIVGQIVSAEAGKLKVSTDFAGTIEVAQAKVRSFTTDQPVNVRLDSGSTVQGRVEPGGEGVSVVAANGSLTARPTGVTNLWQVGAKSPDARTWQYEAALAINGRTGGSEKFAGALNFKATLESPDDKLIFSLAAEQAEDNGVETANRQFASVDYSASISGGKNIWYARTSIEKDEIKQLDLRSSTAFGLGRKLIKTDVQELEARFGLSYLYESYANGTDFESPGLDVTFLHSYQFTNGKLNNMIAYTPTFSFHNDAAIGIS